MISRRSLVAAPAVLAAASALSPFSSPALARAPFAGVSPAVYRFRLGAFEVTALADGTLPMEAEVFPGAQKEPDAAARLFGQSGLPAGAPVRSFVNAYLVNTGERLVLVDTGTGTLKGFGPNLGQLPKNLAAAGVDPGTVDAVVITHLHPDHELGLSPEGKAAFPNAELIVAEPEFRFWTDEGNATRAPDDFKPFFAMARDAVAPYAARTRRTATGEIVPGLTLEPAPGHTPGHSLVRVASGADQMLIWGDVVHLAAIQFDRPDWSIAFDTDQAQAAQTRRRVFDMAAQDRLLVAGMHLPFPGIGRVGRRGDAYAYTPEPWQG